MMTRITAFLVSLSIAAPAVVPAQPAFAAPAARPDTAVSTTLHGAPVIQAGDRGDRRWRDRGDRRWRDRDRRRWERREHRRDYRRDWRRDDRHSYHRHDHRRHDYRRHDYRRHDYRRHDGHRHGHRRDGHRRHDDRDAVYILGGIALGTILLLNIFDRDRDRDRGHRR